MHTPTDGPTPLEQSLERQGGWLFRWRSYLPIPLLVLLLGWVWLVPTSEAWIFDGWPWELFCLAVGLFGLAVRVWVGGQVPAGTSGRNTVKQVASTVNTTGPYSLVRHPLYVGNYFMWLAVALFTGSALVVVVTTAYFWAAYERIMAAEERFLQTTYGDDYLAWAVRTPTFVPSFAGYRPPALPFSWRTALRKEYSGLFGMVAALAALELLEETFARGAPALDPVWQVALAVSAAAYVVLRTLKRRTKVLKVPGR